MAVHAPAFRASPAGAARRLAGPTLWLIVVGNAAVMVALWLHYGGLTGVHDTGARLTSVGRITGLLGAWLALLQVLLLARLPVLERLVGFDRLTVWHRRNGKAALGLILVHTVLVTVGYAKTDQVSVWSEFGSLLSDYPHMVTATVGTGLLILVVVTSLVLVRRRLPYELWQLVHLTAYAGIALGYLHQVPAGTDLAGNHTAAVYWHVLYLATLGLLVVFRVLVPIAQALRFRLRVEAVVREGPGVVSITVAGHDLERLRAHGGQFFRWRFLAPGVWAVSHPFSLSAAPDGDRLRITVKAVGGYTERLAGLAPGTRVLSSGPFGTFTAAARRRRKVLLIAGGIGVTPVRALLEELEPAPGDITIAYRVLAERDLVLRSELEALAEDRGATLHCLVGDHADPVAAALLSPAHLLELVPDLAAHDVFLCGPPAMTNAVERHLRHTSLPRRQLHVERFAY
ncbi:MAG TPA: ferredoxin reductase family protein [Baekduia sp.]